MTLVTKAPDEWRFLLLITNNHRKSWLNALDYTLLAVIKRHIEKPMLADIELDEFMLLNI